MKWYMIKKKVGRGEGFTVPLFTKHYSLEQYSFFCFWFFLINAFFQYYPSILNLSFIRLCYSHEMSCRSNGLTWLTRVVFLFSNWFFFQSHPFILVFNLMVCYPIRLSQPHNPRIVLIGLIRADSGYFLLFF